MLDNQGKGSEVVQCYAMPRLFSSYFSSYHSVQMASMLSAPGAVEDPGT